jgi:5-(carboxyamino)imidazole ribonucleotide mutase
MSEYIEILGGQPLSGKVVVGGAKNAGLLAIRILAAFDEKLSIAVAKFSEDLKVQVAEKNAKLKSQI